MVHPVGPSQQAVTARRQHHAALPLLPVGGEEDRLAIDRGINNSPGCIHGKGGNLATQVMGSNGTRVVNGLPVNHCSVELQGHNNRCRPHHFGFVTALAR